MVPSPWSRVGAVTSASLASPDCRAVTTPILFQHHIENLLLAEDIQKEGEAWGWEEGKIINSLPLLIFPHPLKRFTINPTLLPWYSRNFMSSLHCRKCCSFLLMQDFKMTSTLMRCLCNKEKILIRDAYLCCKLVMLKLHSRNGYTSLSSLGTSILM